MKSPGNTPNDPGRSAGSPSSAAPTSTWPKWMIALCLAGHVWATCRALPPSTVWDCPVLAYHDYALHAHRAHVFREAFRGSGDTWGCDPAVCGGTVMQPTREVGSAIYEIIALILPGMKTGRLVTAIAWCAVLIAPLLLFGAARLLAFDSEQTAWGLLVGTGFLWLAPSHWAMLYFGMIAFLLASFLCLLVLAACDRFLRRPTTAGYLGVVTVASLLFFVHPFGPVAIAPGLVWLIARASDASWRWRVALLAVPLPVAAVNAVWLIPVLKGLHAPPPPWMTEPNLALPIWNWSSWGDFLANVRPELLVGLATVLVASGIGLATLVKRQPRVTIAALGITLVFTLGLFFCGSFWSVTRILQPVRFVAVFLNLSALLMGCTIVGLSRGLRFPWFLRAAAYVITGGILVTLVQFFGQRLASPQDVVDLIAFIQNRTVDGDRLLLDAAPPYPQLGLGLPAITHREIISTVFPDFSDPVQFTVDGLFGSTAENASRERVKEVLARFNVNWVIVRRDPWHEFFHKLTGGPGEAIGPYEAFKLGAEHSRFLVGSGEVQASINRLELRQVSSPQDYVVLRYRYHPGWVCDAPASIEPFPTPDKSGGLILVRHPSATTVLRFDPARALRTPWP